MVEHNQQVIEAADWIVDLGPGGGKDGGQVVFTGTPRQMLKNGKTATADFLRKSLKDQGFTPGKSAFSATLANMGKYPVYSFTARASRL